MTIYEQKSASSLVQDCLMCGTKEPVFLLLPPGSNIAGWRQQYCWLEAAIEDQPILYRQMA